MMPLGGGGTEDSGRVACRNWTGSASSCRFGNECRYAHGGGQNVQRSGWKLCRAWTGVAGSCRFGNNCRFLHADVSPGHTSSSPTAGEPSESSEDRAPKGLSPLAAAFVPTAASHSSAAWPDAGPVPLFVPPSSHDSWEQGEQQSHVSVPVPRACVRALCSAIGQIQSASGGAIHYDPLTEAAVVMGSPAERRSACAEIETVLEEAARRQEAECCICFEAPGKRAGRAGRYGLLEGCDHIVCIACIMKWRQSEDSEMTREARLGCPVCRSISHIIVPWPEALCGEDKLAIVTQHKERCRATPCKWSSQGKRCPAGRHCIFDHSGAPQVRGPPRRHREHRFSEADMSELLLTSSLFFNGLGLGLGLALLDSDDDLEVDEEMVAALELLLADRSRGRGSHRARRHGRQ